MTLTTEDGATTSKDILVTRNGPVAPFAIDLSPEIGLAQLSVVVRTDADAAPAFDIIEFDLDNDGIVDYSATSIEDANFGFAVDAGYYVVKATAKKVDGTVVWTDRKVLYSYAPAVAYNFAKSLFGRLIERLQTPDVGLASNLFTDSIRERMRQTFLDAGSSVGTIATNLGTIKTGKMMDSSIDLVVARDQAGVSRAAVVHIVRDRDGIWRIDGF